MKTVSDLFMPISGKVSEFNEDLESNPEVVNEDPYGKGWMIKIEFEGDVDASELMDAEAYQALIA